MSTFGVWLNKVAKRNLKLVSPHAVDTILAQNGTSMTKLQQVAKKKANTLQVGANKKSLAAQKLSMEANLEARDAREIQDALAELNSAQGKVI